MYSGLKWISAGMMGLMLAGTSCREEEPEAGEEAAGVGGEPSDGLPSSGGPSASGSNAGGDQGLGMAGSGHAESGTGGVGQGGVSGDHEAGNGGMGAEGGVGAAAGHGGAGVDDAVLWLDDCEAIDMSADGKTVLATRGVWRAESGWKTFTPLPGGSGQVILRALSGDGKTVFGNAPSNLGMEMVFFRNGAAHRFGTLNWPLATNANGTFVIGITPPEPAASGPQDWDFDVFRWSEADSRLVLDSFWDAVGVGNVINAPGISFFSNGAGTSGLIVLDLSGSRETLRFEGDLITHATAEGSPDALSRDGMVTALREGYRLTQPTSVRSVSDLAVLDRPECAMEPLDELELEPKCNHVYPIMTGLDATGQQGVGVEEANAAPNIFFHWSQGEDARDLGEFLQERAIMLDLPAGFSPRLARISADARTILGSGDEQGDNKCFLVTF